MRGRPISSRKRKRKNLKKKQKKKQNASWDNFGCQGKVDHFNLSFFHIHYIASTAERYLLNMSKAANVIRDRQTLQTFSSLFFSFFQFEPLEHTFFFFFSSAASSQDVRCVRESQRASESKEDKLRFLTDSFTIFLQNSLNKRVPQNPKFANIQSQIDTGASAKAFEKHVDKLHTGSNKQNRLLYSVSFLHPSFFFLSLTLFFLFSSSFSSFLNLKKQQTTR